MMIRRPPYFSLCCMTIGLVLSACGTKPTSAPTAVETSSGHARGTYKVGQPYQVNGVWYYPAEDFSYDETGIASWYGPNFHEKFTANGEVFDQNAVSAAHKTLPLPSIVQVTNLDNGRTIEVRVNDRGPFVGNRIIDMSRRAAQLLGFEQAGTAKVRVKILVPEAIQAASVAKLGGSDQPPPVETPHAAPRDAVVAQALLPPTRNGVSPAPPPPPLPIRTPPPLPQTAAVEPALPETVSVVPVKPSHIFIQAGAYASIANAVRMKSMLEPLGLAVLAGARVNGLDIYRVRLGPIATVEEADQLLARAVGAGATDAKIVID
jgi:rare lipoprotein A